jgi:hypothetical protein
MAGSDRALAVRVMTLCTRDQAPVFTCHRMRPSDMAALREPRAFRCSRCDQIHKWTQATAWCEDVSRLD